MLILTAILLTGGLALPASAKTYRTTSSPTLSIFISGYSKGVPIYAKRVPYGKSYRTVRLTSYERRQYLKRQRYLQAKRDKARRIARSSYKRAHTNYSPSGRRR